MAAMFLYCLTDDAFQIHEDVGTLIANELTFTPPLNLRLQDFGELTVYAIAGIILILAIGLAYQKGSQAFRNLSHDFLFLVAILVFFGVFLDLAEKLNVSRQTINAIEIGKYDLSLPLAFQIAKLFGKKIEEIFFP